MTVIKWQDRTMNPSEWFDFPLDDIVYLPVSHAVDLFSGKIPVIIKEGEQYIVNTPELFSSYKKKGQKVMMISQVGRTGQKLGTGGFLTC